MYTKNLLSMYSKTILLVDDVPLFLETAEDLFRREQVEILKARSAREALDTVQQSRPDLVFMDLYMPGGDGDEACRQIKNDNNLRSVPVVMVTGSNRDYDIERCRRAGCDEVIHKPLTREQLLETTRRFLKLPRWSGSRPRVRIPARFSMDGGDSQDGMLADIGVGGLFLEAETLLPVGSELQLEFQLDKNVAPIRCRGRVAWITSRAAFSRPSLPGGMGISFSDLKKLDLLVVQGWVGRNREGSATAAVSG